MFTRVFDLSRFVMRYFFDAKSNMIQSWGVGCSFAWKNRSTKKHQKLLMNKDDLAALGQELVNADEAERRSRSLLVSRRGFVRYLAGVVGLSATGVMLSRSANGGTCSDDNEGCAPPGGSNTCTGTWNTCETSANSCSTNLCKYDNWCIGSKNTCTTDNSCAFWNECEESANTCTSGNQCLTTNTCGGKGGSNTCKPASNICSKENDCFKSNTCYVSNMCGATVTNTCLVQQNTCVPTSADNSFPCPHLNVY
jgi:hypothetical protein